MNNNFVETVRPARSTTMRRRSDAVSKTNRILESRFHFDSSVLSSSSLPAAYGKIMAQNYVILSCRRGIV